MTTNKLVNDKYRKENTANNHKSIQLRKDAKVPTCLHEHIFWLSVAFINADTVTQKCTGKFAWERARFYSCK